MKSPKLVTRTCANPTCNRDYIHDKRAHDWRAKLCSIDCYIVTRNRQDEIDDLAFEEELNDAESPWRNGERGIDWGEYSSISYPDA